jgi:hypothetical protein
MDTVLLLTVGRPDIYQHKSLGKSATDFYPRDQYIFKLAADSGKTTSPTLQVGGKSIVSMYPIDFRCIYKHLSFLQRK